MSSGVLWKSKPGLDPGKHEVRRYFETVLISAIQGNFPKIRMQGYFHFCQAVLQQVKLKLCSSTSSESGFGPLKFLFGLCMVRMCESTTTWKIGTAA
ncbi:hypothetical protein T10_5026 [Trichinella papuae]|uniref:Uncharacterized protein n=1 Tax=Trichinella papuae TaxID=268474 RepID=A0A0V1N1C5_9BILA|nr:hypothetical protein T10_5026 [Trichinella papuae]